MESSPLTPHLIKIIERIDEYNPSKDYINMVNKSNTIWDILVSLSKFYKEKESLIIEFGKHNPRKFYDIFSFDFEKLFSPIERFAWDCIRRNKIVFYPQYPVLNYYLDFANPYLKVAIELDGKQFHLDVEKDRHRDQRLYDLAGWKIYRIKGSEAYVDIQKPILKNYSPCESVYEYFHNTMEGVTEAINQVYFYSDIIYDDNERCIFNTCVATLECHKLVEYEIIN